MKRGCCSVSAVDEVAEWSPAKGARKMGIPGRAMVGVPRDAKPKRGAKMRGGRDRTLNEVVL